MVSRDEVVAIARREARSEAAKRPRGGGGVRLPRVFRGDVQVARRSTSPLGIRHLSQFVDYVMANIGGGGGGGGGGAPASHPECPPCVGPAEYVYDAGGRMTEVRHGSPVQVTTTITRDTAGRVTQTQTVWAAGTRTCTYGYDGVGRRTSSSCSFVAA